MFNRPLTHEIPDSPYFADISLPKWELWRRHFANLEMRPDRHCVIGEVRLKSLPDTLRQARRKAKAQFKRNSGTLASQDMDDWNPLID